MKGIQIKSRSIISPNDLISSVKLILNKIDEGLNVSFDIIFIFQYVNLSIPCEVIYNGEKLSVTMD